MSRPTQGHQKCGDSISQPLKLGLAGPSGEGDDVADVLEPSGEQHQALKAQTKAGVRYAAVLPEVYVGLVIGLVQPRGLQTLLQNLQGGVCQTISKER